MRSCGVDSSSAAGSCLYIRAAAVSVAVMSCWQPGGKNEHICRMLPYRRSNWTWNAS